jgi:hypothetical protein
MRVQAQYLKPGDVTLSTGETVVRVFAGIRTPVGKVEVTLTDGERIRRATWGAHTEISIQTLIPTNAPESVA